MKKITLLSLLIVLVLGATNGQNVFMINDSLQAAEVVMEGITIKSPKQTKKLLEMPIAMSQLQLEEIENKQVESIKNLSAVVPNLFIPDYGSKLTSPVYLRGIGSKLNTPAVGLYVDNVPYFEKAIFDFDFFDIESIEVLRGPQGTLYGRNTLGGIINIYTKSPSQKRNTQLNLQSGNYNQFKASISHDQPLGENFTLNIGTSYTTHGGYFENSFLDNSAVDELEQFTGRFRLVHKISPKLKMEYSLITERSEQGGYPYAVYDKETATAEDISYNKFSSYNRDMLSANIYTEYKSSHLLITSITSYQMFDDAQAIDQDFTATDLYFVTQDQRQHMFSEELIFRSRYSHNYNWLGGVFTFYQKIDRGVVVEFGENFSVPGLIYDKDYVFDNQGVAAFHQSTFDNFLVPNLSIVGGLRIDFENNTMDYLYDKYMGETQIPDTAFKNTLEFDELLPKLALNYSINDKVNYYASLTYGYKPGGFNTTIELPEHAHYDPERSRNYEVGIKSSMINDRLKFNICYFYIDIKNQQVTQTVPSGRGSMYSNAGKSHTQGLETELSMVFNESFSVYSNFGYTEAKYDEYIENDELVHSGNYMPFIPRYTFSSGFNYSLKLNSQLVNRISLNANYNGVGEHYWNDENTAKQAYYGLVNSRITMHNRYGSISVFGKNVFNTDYHSYYFEAVGNSYVQLGKPRLFGINIRVNI